MWLRLIFREAVVGFAFAVNSCSTTIPLTCSCRYALMRAIAVRSDDKSHELCRRKILVATQSAAAPKGNQGQLPVHAQHYADDAGQHKDVFKN